MDLFDGLVGALRRWYVLIPVLLITAALALVVSNRKTTQYTSETIVSITTNSVFTQAPVASGAPTITRGNALITNGGVTLVSNLLSIALHQTDVEQAVVNAGGTTRYTVNLEQRGPVGTLLPIIDIQATAASAAPVSATMTALQQQITPALERIQSRAGVPRTNYARYFVIQPASTPSRVVLSTTRNTGIVIVVGVIVALVLAAVLDNVVTRRRGRRHPHPAPPQQEVITPLERTRT